jgi:hypothetical protein
VVNELAHIFYDGDSVCGIASTHCKFLTYPPAHSVTGGYTPAGTITIKVPVADVAGSGLLHSVTGLTATQTQPGSSGTAIFNVIDSTPPVQRALSRQHRGGEASASSPPPHAGVDLEVRKVPDTQRYVSSPSSSRSAGSSLSASALSAPSPTAARASPSGRRPQHRALLEALACPEGDRLEWRFCDVYRQPCFR